MKSKLVRSHGSPIILSRLLNAPAAFNGEKVTLESLDKWSATIASVNALQCGVLCPSDGMVGHVCNVWCGVESQSAYLETCCEPCWELTIAREGSMDVIVVQVLMAKY